MATTTSNYNFTLPDVGGDLNVWGGYLNANWIAIDGLLDTIRSTASSAIQNGTSLGAGAPIFADKSGSDLQFKSLVAGSNITLTQTGNEITIAAAGGSSGEANAGTNVGTGAAFYKDKSGTTLRFRRFQGSSPLTVTENTDDILASVDVDALVALLKTNTAFKRLFYSLFVAGFSQSGGDLTIAHGVDASGNPMLGDCP